jgi:hypothetical protein
MMLVWEAGWRAADKIKNLQNREFEDYTTTRLPDWHCSQDRNSAQ